MPTLCCPARSEMRISCCLQAEKGKKMVSSIFSCVNKPLLVPDSKLFENHFFFYFVEGEERVYLGQLTFECRICTADLKVISYQLCFQYHMCLL